MASSPGRASPPGSIQPDRRRCGQRHRRMQRQRHHRQPGQAGQRPCRLGHRGLRSEADGLAVGDQVRHRRGDPPLAVHDLDRAHRERQFLAAHQQVHRAAPHPPRHPAPPASTSRSRRIVSSAGAELGGRGYHIDPAVPAQDLDQLAQTLRRIHRLQDTPDMCVRTWVIFRIDRRVLDAGPVAWAADSCPGTLQASFPWHDTRPRAPGPGPAHRHRRPPRHSRGHPGQPRPRPPAQAGAARRHPGGGICGTA